jgi:hypothetical protein
MGLDEAGCLVVFAFIVSFIPIIMGSYYLLKMRSIKRSKTRRIGKLVPGKVEINGRAYPFPGKDLKSPIGDFLCVRYLTKVYSTRREKIGTNTETIEMTRWKEIKGDRFLLKDESGSVRIKIQTDEFPMKRMFFERLRPMNPPSPLIQDFCWYNNIDIKGPFGFLNRDLFFKESILPMGQEIYLIGKAERIPIDRELTTIKGISPYEVTITHENIISFAGEKSVIRKYRNRGIGAIIFGAVMVLVSLSFVIGSFLL